MGFVCASDVEPESYDAAEKAVRQIRIPGQSYSDIVQYLQKKKAALASLSEWNHVNCLRASAAELVQDDVLRKIIESSTVNDNTNLDHEIDRSRLDIILTGTDIDTIQATTNANISSGTVSFLFEKHTNSSLEDDIVEQTGRRQWQEYQESILYT